MITPVRLHQMRVYWSQLLSTLLFTLCYYNRSPSLQVNISNCTFYNNSADVTSSTPPSENDSQAPPSSAGSSAQPPSRGKSSPKPANEIQQVRGGVIQDRAFLGRGGGVALIVHAEMRPANLVIEDSYFVDNAALESGGGLYVLLDGLSSHTINISRSRFSGNVSPSMAGGLQFTFLQEGAYGSAHQVHVIDSIFTLNQASYGGAAFFLPLAVNIESVADGQLGIIAKFERCTFDGNAAIEVGGALGAAFYILASAAESFYPLEIVNCTFTRNMVVGGGVVSTAYFPLSFHGTNIFELNQGPSLVAVGSRVRLCGSLIFSSNSNTGSLDGGAIFFTSLSQLELMDGANLTFFNNSGTLGASLVVQNPSLPTIYSRLLYNPLCSLTHTDRRHPPDLWNATLSFIANKAVVAAAVYMNKVDLCSWVQPTPQYFNPSRVFRWNFVHFPLDQPNINTGHNLTSDQLFSVQTPAVRLRISPKELLVFPGENIGLGVATLDELGVATAALFTLSDDSIVSSNGSQDKNGEIYRFTPSSLNVVGTNTRLEVRMKLRSGLSFGRRELIEANMITDNQKFLSIKDLFNISSRPCPPGQKLLNRGGFSDCECDTGNADIINCDRRKVHIEDHLWGTVHLGKSSALSNSLVTHTCPSQYCACTPLNTSGILKCTQIFDDEDPDSQCHCNRTGVLCGDCAEGHGFSALLDSCVSCSDVYSVLIVLLAVVDVAIIVTLLVVSRPVPLFFYPVLFHLQLLPYFTTHFPVTFEKVRPCLVYVASALGLYFPYNFCLYHEASALAVYLFRYLPLFLVVVIIPFAVTIRRRHSPKNTWHGVWWLLLLLYTPVIHTSFSILYCPSLPARNSNSTRISIEPRWFVNGNIECFTGAHIPLGIVAIVVLVFFVLVVPVLLLVAIFMEKKQLPKCPRWCELAVEAFQQSFKYWWWGVMELLRRSVLVLLAVLFPRNNYPVIFALSVLIASTSLIKPYGNKDSHKKKGYAWAVNVLDAFLASNILILLLLRNTQSVEENYEQFPIPDQQLELPASLRMRSTSYNHCNPDSGLTDFAIILTPIFYLPLLVSIVALVVWLCSISAGAFKTCNSKRKPVTVDSEVQDNSRDMTRIRTQTFVDFRSYDPDQRTSPKESIKSPFTLAGKKLKHFSFRSSKRKDKSKKSSFRQDVEKEETKSKGAEKEPEVELKVVGGCHVVDVNKDGRGLKQDCYPTSVIEEEDTCMAPDDISYTHI